MEHKAFPITDIKAPQDGQPGEFTALVAVFGNVDQGGDRIEPGAFARTLKERGLPPIVWSHEWDTPPIGVCTSAQETPEGLVLNGRLFVSDGEDHAVARQVYTAMKAADGNGQSPLREFSFGYSAKDYRYEAQDDGKEIRILTDVELYEAGPTLVGMNPATRLIGVKAGGPAAAGITITVDPGSITTTGTSGTSFAVTGGKGEQDDDNPDNSAQSEEDRERIGRLLADHPIHHVPQEDEQS